MKFDFNKYQNDQLRYNKLLEEMRSEGEKDKPDLEKVGKMEAEIRSLSAIIEAARKEAKANGEILPEERSIASMTLYDNDMQNAPETRAVVNYIKTGDGAELRNMTIGMTGGSDTGGYLVPESWEDKIMEKEKELFIMRQLSDTQISETDRNIPIADDRGASGWIREGEPYPESAATFQNKVMRAHKVGRITKVSEELLQDNAFDLETWLTETFAYTNGIAMESAYFTGSGDGEPKGFLLDADIVEAAGNVLAYDDILALFSSLKAGYFYNASWLMNSKTLAVIMNLKDDSGRYIYQPFTPKEETSPLGEILGRPVALSSFMPDIGAGNKPVAFGDFKYYRIHDRTGFTIQRMNEKYAETGFIGFRGMQRTDGKLLINEAIKVLEF
jgi:HK97 family phage major capsid protein